MSTLCKLPWLAATLMVIVLAGLLAACGGDDDEAQDPAAVVAAYEEARTAGDVDAMIALFAEDAVMLDHPRDDDGTADVEEIRALETEIAGVQVNTSYTKVTVDGNTATFRQELTVDDGECYGGDGQKITVENGLITEWDWGENSQPCE